MKLVRQKHSMGCGVACMAMLLDVTYEEAAAHFKDRNLETNGVVSIELDSVLADLGYAIQIQYPKDHRWQEREQWPPAPFAERHVCQVYRGLPENSGCAHMVVMDQSGIVFDPLQDELTTLLAYQTINHVKGVHRVQLL